MFRSGRRPTWSPSRELMKRWRYAAGINHWSLTQASPEIHAVAHDIIGIIRRNALRCNIHPPAHMHSTGGFFYPDKTQLFPFCIFQHIIENILKVYITFRRFNTRTSKNYSFRSSHKELMRGNICQTAMRIASCNIWNFIFTARYVKNADFQKRFFLRAAMW